MRPGHVLTPARTTPPAPWASLRTLRGTWHKATYCVPLCTRVRVGRSPSTDRPAASPRAARVRHPHPDAVSWTRPRPRLASPVPRQVPPPGTNSTRPRATRSRAPRIFGWDAPARPRHCAVGVLGFAPARPMGIPDGGRRRPQTRALRPRGGRELPDIYAIQTPQRAATCAVQQRNRSVAVAFDPKCVLPKSCRPPSCSFHPIA